MVFLWLGVLDAVLPITGDFPGSFTSVDNKIINTKASFG